MREIVLVRIHFVQSVNMFIKPMRSCAEIIYRFSSSSTCRKCFRSFPKRQWGHDELVLQLGGGRDFRLRFAGQVCYRTRVIYSLSWEPEIDTVEKQIAIQDLGFHARRCDLVKLVTTAAFLLTL